MPFSGFEDFDDCLETMTEEEGHDMESAENICGALQAEEKSDHGNVDELRQALEQGAGLIADVGVDLVSGVDVPAVDSKWVMTKDTDGHDWRASSPILLAKQDDEDEDDEDQRISYAAAMIPREPDKEGDVVATPTVERAAHDFLKSDGGVDTDHSLIDGEGEVVESWVLKQERTFDLPGGETETYGAGTWMTGIEWGADAWARIKAGDLTGLSIYGMAEHVPLERSACDCPPTTATAKQLDIPLANEAVVHLVYESQTAAEKASEEIGLDGDIHEHEFDGMDVWMPGESHEAFVDRYMELSDEASDEVARTADMSESPDTHKGAAAKSDGMASDNSGDGGGDPSDDGDSTDNGPDIEAVAASVDDLAGTVESLKEAVETDKADDQEAAAMLAEERGMEPGDILDILSVAEGKDTTAILDAVDEIEASSEETKADDEDEEDDEEEEDMEASAEKRADGANLEKGTDGRDTAAAGHEATGEDGDPLSYRAVAEQQGDF